MGVITAVQLLVATGTRAWALARPAASEQSRARFRLPADVVHAVISCKVTDLVQELLQLALVTVRESVIGVLHTEPAVTVTVCPLAAPIMVPFVTLHE